MAPIIDITGQRFGRLIAIREASRNRYGLRWLCRCDCGNETVVQGTALRSGAIKSCGCLRREVGERLMRHGHARDSGLSPTYQSWSSMIGRCTYPKCNGYKNYGGRGITVCEWWLGEQGFANFLADMGERPEGRTLDRIDVDGNYEPGNCRWATDAEQRANRRARAA